MKEIYNGETVALGGVNLVTKQVIVDDSTGEKAKFTYDRTTGSITVLDEVDPDSVNPVTARAVATAVAGASGEVPVIGDDDNGKVLKAVVSGGQKSAEWGEAAPAVTVDQHYSASSANAQSGTAVAEAIASIPSSSYTAGDGIEISNDNIAVRAGKNLDFANTMVATDLYAPTREYGAYYLCSFIGQLNMTRIAQLRQGMTIKMHSIMSLNMTGSTGGAHFAICRKNSDNTPNLSGSVVLVADAALTTDTSSAFRLESGYTYVADFSSLSEKSVGSFNDIDTEDADKYYLTLISYGTGDSVSSAKYINSMIYDPGDANTAEYYTENPAIKELVAVDQLPASTSADANKVLTVNSSGNPAWATPAGSDVVTASGSFKLGGSVPVKVNYTGSPDYERGSLRLVNTFAAGNNYAVAMFEVVGSHNIYYETFGSATLTINDPMFIADTGNSTLTIAFSDSDSQFNPSRYLYRDSFTRTDGKIDAQSLSFWNATPYNTGSYIGVGIIPEYGPDAGEKIAEVLQQLANGAVSISNWPVEEVMVTTMPSLPSFTSSDSGKVLQVQADGTLAWVTLS